MPEIGVDIQLSKGEIEDLVKKVEEICDVKLDERKRLLLGSLFMRLTFETPGHIPF